MDAGLPFPWVYMPRSGVAGHSQMVTLHLIIQGRFVSYKDGCELSGQGGEKGSRQMVRGRCSIPVGEWRRWLEQGGGRGSGRSGGFCQQR